MIDFEARLASLRQRFVASASQQAGALMSALDRNDRDRAIEVAHHLAGISGIFGEPALSALASALETALNDELPDTVIRAHASAVFVALRTVSHNSSPIIVVPADL